MWIISLAENDWQQLPDKRIVINSKDFHIQHLFRGADGQSGACLRCLNI